MFKLNKIISRSLILCFLCCLFSCGNHLELKPTVFKKDMEETLLKIGQTSSFSDVQFTLSANQINKDLPYYELELKLINGQNMPGTEAGLDSLAKSVAIILKNSIENIQDYEWIFVLFDDPVSAKSTKKTFGYRTSKIN